MPWRLRLLVLALVVTGALALDLTRPPPRQWSARAAIVAIHAYQRVVSPWMWLAGARCRFEPTCSRYAEVAIARHGLLAGGIRSLGRVMRCGPWTPAGTVDLPD